MKLVRNVVGVLLLLIGLVWLGQGVGLIQGSFMTGEAQWALIGIVCIILGGGVLYLTNRRRVQG
ncbi:MAG: hypothetical protein GC204_00670 [Chloroflexi bacterium]|nr:hypothetical protein [Chloroflexota bacterium]